MASEKIESWLNYDSNTDFPIQNFPLGVFSNADPEKIKEIVLYFEPFVAYIPESHSSFQKEEIEVADLNINEILLLQDGHCFRDGILNLCKKLLSLS